MNSTDDFLERLRKKQAEKKESKLAKIKGFFRTNAKKFLLVGLFVIVPLMLARIPGIGFTATVNIISSRMISLGERFGPFLPSRYVPPTHCYIHSGTVNATFNPILYPVNHLFRSEFSAEFARRSGYWDYSGELVKESIIDEILFSNFPINIPFFFAVGLVLAVGLEKAIRKVS